MVSALGVIAAICLSLSGVPQALSCWRQKSSEGISLSMILMIEGGILFTGAYIYELHGIDWILHGQYTFQFLIWLVVLWFKLFPKRN